MEITLEKLLEGKATIIKNKEYLPTSDYVSPFLDQMSKFTDNFTVQVRLPTQITTTAESDDVTYNRVWIQAILPEKYCIENHDEVYGLVYGLDVRTPVYKVYRGMLNRACTNLCVFDPSWMEVNEIKPGENFIYHITALMEKVSHFEATIKKMKNTVLSSDVEERHNRLGNWIEKCVLEEYTGTGGKVKLSPSTVIDAYNGVYFDSSSKYYVGDEDSTVFNFYNAFTEIIKDDKKDIINKFEKTLLINSLFEL